MTKVPLSVIIGKSPMKTVCDLISPVSVFSNSAVTNSGASYVRSFSRQSSRDALTSSKYGSENDRDMDPEKSSIGEISLRIASRPPSRLVVPRAAASWVHASEPMTHSNDSVWRSSSPGTGSGSESFANETLLGAPGTVETDVVWRETAKMGPSSTSRDHHGR